MAFLDETGLAELWELIKAEDEKGAKIATGSYTGTGKYGSSNPCSLTFDFVPKAFIVFQSETRTAGEYMYPGFQIWVAGSPWMFGFYWDEMPTAPTNYSSNSVHYFIVSSMSAADKTLTYYNNVAYTQFNNSGMTYRYIAIG